MESDQPDTESPSDDLPEFEDEFNDAFEADEFEADDELDEAPHTETVEIRATLTTTDPAVIGVLEDGEIEVLGRMPYSSNGTFLVDVRSGDDVVQAIYKPEAGERPLWDFPPGLWRRERAAYVLGRMMGLEVVPPTVVRHDAPLGVGSVQCFVPAQFELHYFDFVTEPEHQRILQRLGAFDVVSNNTDRKAGHCLIDLNGRIWAIDNGLSFHSEFKLRTVIWDFAGQPLDADDVAALAELLARTDLGELDELLMPDEIDALRSRAQALLTNGRMPIDPSGQRYPWPLV